MILGRRYVNSTLSFILFVYVFETGSEKQQRAWQWLENIFFKKVNASHLRGDLCRDAEVAVGEVTCHQL